MAKKFRDPALERRWRDRVAAWAASGLSIRAFCDQHQLTETTFQYWRRELRERDAGSVPSLASPRFVPVTVRPPGEPVRAVPASTGSIEVRCPSGHVVSLPNADVEMLRSVFTTLARLSGEGSPC